MKSLKIIVLTVFLVFFASYAFGVRVNSRLIEVGDSKSEVLIIAGKPMNMRIIKAIYSSTRTVYVECWTYKVDWYGSTQYYDFIFCGRTLMKIIHLDID